MTDIVERLHQLAEQFRLPDLVDAADEIERLRKATGGLPPALVAKALAVIGEGFDLHDFTEDEIAALRAATFEVPE